MVLVIWCREANHPCGISHGVSTEALSGSPVFGMRSLSCLKSR
jgi:hypothetical protein